MVFRWTASGHDAGTDKFWSAPGISIYNLLAAAGVSWASRKVAGRVAFRPLRNPRPLPGDGWRAGSLDSHLGGARTLILPGRIGPATRESA